MITQTGKTTNQILQTPANKARDTLQPSDGDDKCAAESNMLINTDSSHNKAVHDNIVFSASPEVA